MTEETGIEEVATSEAMDEVQDTDEIMQPGVYTVGIEDSIKFVFHNS